MTRVRRGKITLKGSVPLMAQAYRPGVGTEVHK